MSYINKFLFFASIWILGTFAVSASSIIPLEGVFGPNPGSYKGRREVKGRCEYLPDSKSVKIEYDFSSCLKTGFSFLRMGVNKEIPGKPIAITCDVVSETAVPGAMLRIWFNDRNGEWYMSQTKIKNNGEKTVRFTMPSYPAWSSGDKNSKIDLPLRLVGFSVDMTDKKQAGEVELSNLKLETDLTQGCPFTMKIVGRNYFWGTEKVELKILLKNYAGYPTDSLSAEIVIKNRYNGIELTRKKVKFTDVNKELAEAKCRLSIPFGSYMANVNLIDDKRNLNDVSQRRSIQHFYADCSKASKELREYEMKWSPVGGVWGFMTPEFADKFGARWKRFEGPGWINTETAPGVYDPTQITVASKKLRDHYIRPITLQTIYHYPEFRNPKDICDFSTGYGQYHKYIAKFVKKYITDFELGNEDNGNSKFIYTEIARNAAAGIRSAQPFAVIANSGTAFVDYNWLVMQMNRGLLNYVDALCVHPYTNNSTPSQKVSAENNGVLNHLENLNNIIDASGGMKELWSTEFGWPNRGEALEKERAELYLREMAVMDVAGMKISGIYTFKRDYGTVDYPAGVAVNAYAGLLAGYRVAGFIIDENIWIVVYEKSGSTIALAWTPGNKSFPLNIQGRKYYDLFGNSISGDDLQITHSPIYVEDVDDTTVKKAVEELGKRKKQFFLNCLSRYPAVSVGNALKKAEPVNSAILNSVLLEWTSGKGGISPEEKAVIGRIYDWYIATSRLQRNVSSQANVVALESKKNDIRSKINKLNSRDIDLPGVRYLLRGWDRISAERQLAKDNNAYVSACLEQEAVTAKIAERFIRDEKPFMYSVFTALYMQKGDDYTEKLTFVAGQSGVVMARISSCSDRDHKITVIPVVPSGWKCFPEKRTVQVAANSSVFVNFSITPGKDANSKNNMIKIETVLPGLPATVAAFDEIEVVPALTIEVLPINTNLSKSPVAFVIENQTKKSLSGSVRFMVPGKAGKAVAEYNFNQIKPREKVTAKVMFHKLPEKLAENWTMIADVALDDGRRFKVPVKLDFVRAIKASGHVKIDSRLDEWNAALPLKLDKKEYTGGSYGGGWSPDNCSATTWLMWDTDNLYFAAKVRDQTFNQLYERDSMWKQDSIQIIFTADRTSKYQELSMALSPAGPKIWSNGGYMTNAAISVEYRDRTIYYEAAIPWKVFTDKGMRDAVKKGRFLYAVAVNDDDAISSRCFLERFKGSIVHGKNVSTFAEVKLADDDIELRQDKGIMFFDDFNSDKTGMSPKAWMYHYDKMPSNSSRCVEGAGVDGSTAVVLVNHIGYKPNCFAILYSEVDHLTPGNSYRLEFQVKGNAADNDRMIGTCADPWGNVDFGYATWKPSNKWQTVITTFTGPASGKLNVIIRNIDKTEGLVIDNVKIVKAEKTCSRHKKRLGCPN